MIFAYNMLLTLFLRQNKTVKGRKWQQATKVVLMLFCNSIFMK